MELRGYLVNVTLTDDLLAAEGTNKASRIALRGQQHEEGPLVISRSEIAEVEHKAANPLVNGSITIHTTSGAKYKLHFRRKSNAEFQALADALNSASGPAG